MPAECLRLVRCVGGLAPEDADAAEALYGANGTCWCGTSEEAEACSLECVDQLTNALEQFPTVAECHENFCTLDQLDPDVPYGPVVDGACPSWNGSPQLPLEQPLGLPGSVCAPPCSGLALACPQHPQTAADGRCFLVVDDTEYCVTLCYVDPTVVGGTQCQCGATCQPHGGTDGEGYLRGVCTFE